MKNILIKILDKLLVDKSLDGTKDVYAQLDLFGKVFDRVRSEYVDTVDYKELIEDAINGMLVGLDPHSSYLGPDDPTNTPLKTDGKLGGLGIEITMEDGYVKIVSPIDGTPGYRIGLKAGDFITHIDGNNVLGLTLNDAVNLMRGPVGIDVKLKIKRKGVKKALVFNITRAVILNTKAVKGCYFNKSNIGYLRVSTFNGQTTSGLVKNIEKIKKNKELQGFILDLRNNPGGVTRPSYKGF